MSNFVPRHPQVPKDRYPFGQIRGHYIGYRPVTSPAVPHIGDEAKEMKDFIFKTIPLEEQLAMKRMHEQQQSHPFHHQHHHSSERQSERSKGEEHTAHTIDAVLKSLSRSTKYEIILQAYNSKGAGPSSEILTAVTYHEGEIMFVVSSVVLLFPENANYAELDNENENSQLD